MSAEYTVPALRDQATQLRHRAEEVLRGAQVEAEKFRTAASELDAMADGLMGAPADVPVACWNCTQPVVKDELGWRHTPGAQTACQVPGPSEHDHYRAGPEDTLVVSQQSVVETAVDGTEAGS